jgi:hypothetical protein
MSASDDDDLEGDDKLRSMRAVWLSMRDEEPSDKGLAALMAAAREKADSMKEAEAKPEESWWQKVLAAFRRPPVLALASVAILVSGALVIANRSDQMAVDEKASSPAPTGNTAPAPETDRRTENDARAETTAAGSGTLDHAAPGAAATAPAVASPESAEPPADPQKNATVDAPVVRQRPARERARETRGATKDAVKKLEDSFVRPEPPPPPSPEPEAATTSETPVPRTPVTRAPTTRPPPAEPIAGGLGATSTGTMSDGESAGADVDVKAKDEAASGRAQARVLQLVKQCETAAARGDCAAVKVMAARIRSEDATVYKTRVVKNASIARCLE